MRTNRFGEPIEGGCEYGCVDDCDYPGMCPRWQRTQCDQCGVKFASGYVFDQHLDHLDRCPKTKRKAGRGEPVKGINIWLLLVVLGVLIVVAWGAEIGAAIARWLW
jgi:hypothetical protein